MNRPSNDIGMTLIELVVAMAIFALVAIMGLQSLAGTLRIRDRLVAIDDQNTDLGLALAMLRNDLSAVIPLLFYPPDRGAPRSALRLTSGGAKLSLSIGSQPDLDTQTLNNMHRAEWRLDRESTKLYRRIWTTLTPANQSALQPEALILDGITDFSIRTYWDGQGWLDGTNNPLFEFSNVTEAPDGDIGGGPPEIYSDILPSGVEISITTVAHGTLTMIEGL